MKLIYVLLLVSLLLAACSSAPQAVSTSVPNSSLSTPSNEPAAPATNSPTEANRPSSQTSESVGQSSTTEDLSRIDEQGAVVVEVTPVNLSSPGESLEFDVALNTHSVDLSMDLAPLAMLNTDSGKTVQASQWDAPSGGHHVSGKLIFPAMVDGQSVLNGANKLTLTIKNLDAPERVFSWDLSS